MKFCCSVLITMLLFFSRLYRSSPIDNLFSFTPDWWISLSQSDLIYPQFPSMLCQVLINLSCSTENHFLRLLVNVIFTLSYSDCWLVQGSLLQMKLKQNPGAPVDPHLVSGSLFFLATLTFHHHYHLLCAAVSFSNFTSSFDSDNVKSEEHHLLFHIIHEKKTKTTEPWSQP